MIDSLAGATEKLRDLAAARAPGGEFLTVTLSTSRLDDWRQFAPTFLNSEFTRITKERGSSKEEKHVLQSELDEIARGPPIRSDAPHSGPGPLRRRRRGPVPADRAAFQADQPGGARTLSVRAARRACPLPARAVRRSPGEPGRVEPVLGR